MGFGPRVTHTTLGAEMTTAEPDMKKEYLLVHIFLIGFTQPWEVFSERRKNFKFHIESIKSCVKDLASHTI